MRFYKSGLSETLRLGTPLPSKNQRVIYAGMAELADA